MTQDPWWAYAVVGASGVAALTSVVAALVSYLGYKHARAANEAALEAKQRELRPSANTAEIESSHVVDTGEADE